MGRFVFHEPQVRKNPLYLKKKRKQMQALSTATSIYHDMMCRISERRSLLTAVLSTGSIGYIVKFLLYFCYRSKKSLKK